MKSQVLGVIPARLASARLTRKPLHLLAGRTLMEWVWRRVVETELFSEVVIATESDEVAEEARRFGARTELTSQDHPSGTDRIAEVARRREYRGYASIVNIQGDEPFVSASQLEPTIALTSEAGWQVGTAATTVSDSEELHDPAAVKVVLGDDARALYFSRAPIPVIRDADPTPADFSAGAFLRHLGIYAYQAEALQEWVRLTPGRLERMEQLEQLRPLAAGMRIGVAIVPPMERGVDTPADAVRVESRLRAELLDVAK
ncbi:MAG: 3-deoxy-manno-octulosonate cytidylyltransferase [Gemmatimonadetes bacterium]|nr:3-deoxy-manno-octulosonate cytidylyltransferase [Gemmatimonadota bacterium]